jgi:hypothetical protein
LPNTRILINKDTLTCLSDQEVKLINKIIVSEKFYHSIYGTHISHIKFLEDKVAEVEGISKGYKTANDMCEQRLLNLEAINTNLKNDYSELEGDAEDLLWRKNTWKTVSIVGIPVSFIGGIIFIVTKK